MSLGELFIIEQQKWQQCNGCVHQKDGRKICTSICKNNGTVCLHLLKCLQRNRICQYTIFWS